MRECESMELPLCVCECGQRVTNQQNKFLSGHNARVLHPTKTVKYRQTLLRSKLERIRVRLLVSLSFCECGCGGRVSKQGNRFIHGHNARLQKRVVIKKSCLNCGKDFEAASYLVKQGYGKFCSQGCYGIYMRGKPRPDISQTLKRRYPNGRKPWNKGLTKETDPRIARGVEKMRDTKLRFFAWSSFWRLVERLDSEPKSVKISRIIRRMYETGEFVIWNKGKTKEDFPQLSNAGMRSEKFTEETREKLRRARLNQVIPSKDTSVELAIQHALEKVDINYRKHVSLLGKYQVDLLIGNIVIECDGDYWHNYPDGTEEDKVRDKELELAGFIVFRFWGSDIRKDVNSCVDKVCEVMSI